MSIMLTSPTGDAVDTVTADDISTDGVGVAESPGIDTTLPAVVVDDEPLAPAIDFSSLPPADYELALTSYGAEGIPLRLTIREDSGSLVVELVRFNAIDLPMELRVEEISYSGNRSPWATAVGK